MDCLLKAVIFKVDSALQIMSHTSAHSVRPKTLHEVLCIVLEFLDYNRDDMLSGYFAGLSRYRKFHKG